MSEAPATPTPLDNIPLFSAIPAQLRGELAQRLQRAAFNAGDVIVQEGGPGDALYVIEEGFVSVFVTDDTLGLTVDVATLGRGESFGEMALVSGDKRTASVRALEKTSTFVLQRDVFYRLVQAVPQMGLSIAAVLSRRLEQLNRTQRVAFGSLRGVTMPEQLKGLVPHAVAMRHKMVPFAVNGAIVSVACVDPQNRVALDEIRRLLRGADIKLMAVSNDDFLRFVATEAASDGVARILQQNQQNKNYAALAKGQVSFFGSAAAGADDAQKLQQAAGNADVVELLNQILFEAVDRGASDIHLEPDRTSMMVRYRIDGRLQSRPGEIPAAAQAAIVSRCKVLASLDIAERRMPQDGRISLKVGQKNYDLRLATVNTKYGEKIVMRVLDPGSLQADLSNLVLADKVCQAMRNLFYRPNGLVLVTGPTGSGKSTTLYAALAERRNPELSIVTIEDPIEYTMDGITQVQVNEGIGLGFADVMRTYLRQDPNVILVGETRDAATAKLACSAALTGHLVISSLHTNDAISAVQRLRAMEVENHLLGDALLGVVNQRLVRRICPACRVEAPVGDLVVQNLVRAGVGIDAKTKLYRGSGCARCNGEGFKGRAGVYELLVVGAPLKEAVGRGATAQEIKGIAEQNAAYVPLSRYATFLLQEGITVPSEVLRVVPKADVQVQQ